MKGAPVIRGHITHSEIESVLFWLNAPEMLAEIPDKDGRMLQLQHVLVSRSEIRRLVTDWNNSGRRVEELQKSHRELTPYFGSHQGTLPLTGALQIEGTGLRVYLLPRSPMGDYSSVSAADQAVDQARLWFIGLLLNPDRDRLCEKPCARCGGFFLKRTCRQNVYCSRACGRHATAAHATKKRLSTEHDEKLRVAAQQARKWMTVRTKRDWKHWVCSQPEATELELTPKFLTRAVNKGELVDPQKGGD